MEEWRAIDGYDGYEVSNLGRVRSFRSRQRGFRLAIPIIRKPGIVKDSGTQQVTLFDVDGRRKLRFVHNLVLEAFVGPRPDGMQGCHGDDDPRNNRLSNLRWDTPLGNMRDRERNGHTARGSRTGTSTLTDQQVTELLRAHRDGARPSALALRFGIDRTHVWRITRGKAWTHIAL